MRRNDSQVCPCCGSQLVVVGEGDILTLEEAQDLDMDARIDRDLRAREMRWEGEEEPDGA